MKKIIAILITVIMVFSLTACNYKLVDTKWDFNVAYINYGDHVERVEVKSWAEDETSFTIETKDNRVICTHQMNVVMVKE